MGGNGVLTWERSFQAQVGISVLPYIDMAVCLESLYSTGLPHIDMLKKALFLWGADKYKEYFRWNSCKSGWLVKSCMEPNVYKTV